MTPKRKSNGQPSNSSSSAPRLASLAKELEGIVARYGSSVPGVSSVIGGLIKAIRFTPPPTKIGGGGGFSKKRVTF